MPKKGASAAPKVKAAPRGATAEGSVFDVAFAQLNDRQRLAVETIEGPLMVVAGPGTGKTQVVAVRVANILKRTHARPSNILCLTYSVSGATAMRERLRTIIGPDAYGIEVTTIHGFCNDLIQRHPEVFHDMQLLEQVTDVERCRIMNRVLDARPSDSVIVNPKDPHGRTPALLSRISQCKREAVSPEAAAKAAAQYRGIMETKSKQGTKAHTENLRRAAQAEEFAEVYAAYEQTMRQRGLYDYEDMIRFAVEGMRREDWLLATLQERFQYILVDEFQDTNGAQHSVIETLTSLPDGLAPNICVVGDDDQAIYRFQGASVRGMLTFTERHPGCPVVVLTTNYRSTQPILDTAGALIAHNEERLVRKIPDLEKTLVSAAGEADGSAPRMLRPPSDAVEGFAIADLVEGYLQKGIPASEIAVLVRTNNELFSIADVFRARGIRTQITGKLNLLHHAKVREVIALLGGVTAPTDNAALADALGCASLGIHPADIARLWAFCREPKLKLVDALANLELSVEKGQITLHDARPLLKARDLLLQLHQRSASMSLPELLERLLRDTGIVGDHTTDPIDVVALTEFFDHVKCRCYETADFGLKLLLEDLEYRSTYALPLQYAIPHLIDDGVQLMTAHGSKGLEFTVVIVAGFREKHWDRRRPLVSLSLPDDLLFGGSQEEGLEDERRLAYVAWTRAKRHLILSCPERVVRGDREQDVSPSAFAVEGGPVPERPLGLSDPARASTLLLPKAAAIDDAMQNFLRDKLETFELSVTALNHFLEDPQRFLRDDLLGLPQAKSATQSYGTAVHEALKAWGRAAHAGTPLNDDAFIAAFHTAILEREIIIDSERRRLAEYGERELLRFAEAKLRTIPIVYAVEKKITARLPDIDGIGVPLKGMIDRMDLERPDGAVVHIIDYKTGKPKNERQVREDNNGDLYRQLAFYKLLIHHSPSMAGFKPSRFVLEFVGDRDDEPRTLTFDIPDADVASLEQIVRGVWAKILALDFTPIKTDSALQKKE